jgi:hypothetical protein
MSAPSTVSAALLIGGFVFVVVVVGMCIWVAVGQPHHHHHFPSKALTTSAGPDLNVPVRLADEDRYVKYTRVTNNQIPSGEFILHYPAIGYVQNVALTLFTPDRDQAYRFTKERNFNNCITCPDGEGQDIDPFIIEFFGNTTTAWHMDTDTNTDTTQAFVLSGYELANNFHAWCFGCSSPHAVQISEEGPLTASEIKQNILPDYALDMYAVSTLFYVCNAFSSLPSGPFILYSLSNGYIRNETMSAFTQNPFEAFVFTIADYFDTTVEELSKMHSLKSSTYAIQFLYDGSTEAYIYTGALYNDPTRFTVFNFATQNKNDLIFHGASPHPHQNIVHLCHVPTSS